MRRAIPKLWHLLLSLLCLVGAAWPLLAEDSPKKVADEAQPDAVPKGPDSALMKIARDHMKLLKFRTVTEDGEVDVELLPNPVLVYGDEVRKHESGTLWVWGKTGRPAALMELYRDGDKTTPWIHALTMTSTAKIRFKGTDGPEWTPKVSHFKLQDVPGKLEVSDKPAARLRQMKEIARRFEAHEFWNGRQELRLLVQPVHRYEDNANKVIDGTVFIIAHATNPQVILQIEAIDETPPRWKFSLAPEGSGEIHVLFDGKEVWTVPPGGMGSPFGPYYLLYTAPKATSLK